MWVATAELRLVKARDLTPRAPGVAAPLAPVVSVAGSRMDCRGPAATHRPDPAGRAGTAPVVAVPGADGGSHVGGMDGGRGGPGSGEPFTCNLVIGNSTTEQWFDGGFLTHAGIAPTHWELFWVAHHWMEQKPLHNFEGSVPLYGCRTRPPAGRLDQKGRRRRFGGNGAAGRPPSA
jgi:hypothetical protein